MRNNVVKCRTSDITKTQNQKGKVFLIYPWYCIGYHAGLNAYQYLFEYVRISQLFFICNYDQHE